MDAGQILTLAAAAVPMSVWHLRGGRHGGHVLLFLYCATAAGLAASLSLPFIDWSPNIKDLFGPMPEWPIGNDGLG